MRGGGTRRARRSRSSRGVRRSSWRPCTSGSGSRYTRAAWPWRGRPRRVRRRGARRRSARLWRAPRPDGGGPGRRGALAAVARGPAHPHRHPHRPPGSTWAPTLRPGSPGAPRTPAVQRLARPVPRLAGGPGLPLRLGSQPGRVGARSQSAVVEHCPQGGAGGCARPERCPGSRRRSCPGTDEGGSPRAAVPGA